MIHPNTVVRSVSPEIGLGVFATEPIPCGTIVVVRDGYDICLSQEEYCCLSDSVRASMETYMYHDRCGNLVLSWDHARYMNHNCHSNTMMTAYNLEIAVRDIAAGEEMTTEYGLLNIQQPYEIFCGCENCRGRLRLDDIEVYGDEWDRLIHHGLASIPKVAQPLLSMITGADRDRLDSFLAGNSDYASIKTLQWQACEGQL
ncbi:SET domain-containing protein [Pseudodesulfovibrio sp.]|uniref:SET domain-containing protein n=1 Tax=unclassified Pseudodesulfovibrio TaxID=2661612 RepID=UPI003AFFC14D